MVDGDKDPLSLNPLSQRAAWHPASSGCTFYAGFTRHTVGYDNLRQRQEQIKAVRWEEKRLEEWGRTEAA